MLALASCGAGNAPAAKQTPLPGLVERVVDRANLLSPAEEKALATSSAKLERETGHQLVVVTTPSLGGKPIEAYGLALGNSWKIGRKGHDDGVLLIVAPNERKVRIEVGYGLEKTLTNAEAGGIIAQKILPAFREGDYPAGIRAGLDGIVGEIGPGAAR